MQQIDHQQREMLEQVKGEIAAMERERHEATTEFNKVGLLLVIVLVVVVLAVVVLVVVLLVVVLVVHCVVTLKQRLPLDSCTDTRSVENFMVARLCDNALHLLIFRRRAGCTAQARG